MQASDDAAEELIALTVDEQGIANPIITAIDEAADAQHVLEQQLRNEFGTNNTDFRALLLVFRMRRRGLEVHPGDLTRGLGTSTGTTSQIIARLAEAGLLERTADPEDARAGRLDLSRSASRRMSSSTKAVRADLDEILDSLDADERTRILRLLGRVRDVFTDHSSRRAS